jgi:hypothetical protein
VTEPAVVEVPPADDAPPAVRVATARGVAAWLVLVAVLGALDGLPGTVAALVVGVVVLARLPRRWIGLVGVAALVAVPVVVVAGGVPTEAQVSPAFVTRSMWPHHLAFVGLALVCTAAVLELLPSLRSLGRAGVVHAEDDDVVHRAPFASIPAWARYASVAVVALGLLVACVVVLQA